MVRVLEINEYKGEASQQFYISDNFNGSYIIKTRLSWNNSAVEIKDAGIESGNIIQQWALMSITAKIGYLCKKIILDV